MLAPLILLPALLTPATPATPAAGAATEPPVHVWLSSNGEYQQGDEARVYVKSAQDGYLVVLRVDADGHIRVLFPLDPGEDNFVRGEEKYEIRGRADRDAFEVSERSGNGLVLAAFSLEPFTFDGLVRGDHWDYGAIEAQYANVDDPEAQLLDVAQEMAGDQHFDYDVATYIAGAPATYYRTYRTQAWGWDDGCYYCSPWYYGGTGLSVILSFGNPFWYQSWGYWPTASPFFFSPFRFPHRSRVFAGGFGPFGYLPGYYSGWFGDGWYGGGWNGGGWRCGYGDCDRDEGYRRGSAVFVGLGLGVGGVHRVGWGNRGRTRIPVFLPDRPVGPRFADPNPRLLTTIDRRPVQPPARAVPTARAPQQPRVRAPREPSRHGNGAAGRGNTPAVRGNGPAARGSMPRGRISTPRGHANVRHHQDVMAPVDRTPSGGRSGLRVMRGDPPVRGEQPTIRREQPRMRGDRPGIRVDRPTASRQQPTWSWARPQFSRRSAPAPRARNVAPAVRQGGQRGGAARVGRSFSGQRGGARASSPRGGGRRHH
jgi:Domain of unknown function (DUF4384)